MDTEQYFLGKQAFLDSESLDDNPYDMGSPYWEEWEDSYIDAMTDDGHAYDCGCGQCDMSYPEDNEE